MSSERSQSTHRPSGPPASDPEKNVSSPGGSPKSLVRQWIDRTLEQAREADPILKKKAGIVSGWLVLSLIAVLIVVTPHCGEGGLETTARLRIQQVPGLSQAITAFYLENNGSQLWDKIELTLNDRYKLLMPSLAPGQNTVAQLNKFKDGDAWATDSIPLNTLRLRCTAGSVTFDLKTGLPIDQ